MVKQLKSNREKVYKNDEELLDEIVPRFVKNKKKMDELKKECDADNKLIKKILLNKKLSEYKAGKTSVNISSYEKISFDEDMLIAKIKELGVKGLIKTREYVDMTLLELAILDKRLDAKKITKCQIIKPIVNLNVGK